MVAVRFAHGSGALRRGGAGCAGECFTSGPSHAARHAGRSPSLLAVITLLLLAACGDGGGDEQQADGPTTTIRRATAEEVPVTVGQCGNVPRLRVGGALDPATITEVACSEPHDVEIGAVFDYPAGPDLDFPGAVSVDGYATDQCIERFEAYVGAPYATSVLDVLIIAPDEDGWDAGDRRIACVLYHVDFQDLTGSVAGSGL
jgi:hypothetical protein